MSDADLIRRGDAIAWCEEQHRTWAKSHGRDPEKYVGTFTIAADILRRIPARPEQEPPSPAPNTADLLNLIRWAHGTLYEINPSNYDHDEVCRLNDASVEVILGLAPVLGETHGKSPEWWTDHRVGPLPSPGVTAGVTGDTPIGGRVRFAVPAGRTWNDMREWLHTDPKGQSLHQHGDCLLVWANEDDLFATPAPVVPAEGLDAEHLVAAWLDEMEVFATRRERLMDDVLAECDLAPWLHAACQVGIDAALRAHQPAAPVSGVTVREAGWRPIETAPHEELVVLGWQENGVWKQEIALASAGERFPNGYSNMWAHGCATHWMPLPEPPAALLPAGEGE